MIFGNKETIAIQFELDGNYDGLWMYGKFCFYINNQMVGFYDMGATLRDVMNSLILIIKNKNKRYFPQLFPLKDREILQIIIRSCYDDSTTEYPFQDLNIFIVDECMDPFFIYAIDGEYQTKIIYGQCCPIINGKRGNTRINDKYNFKEDPENIISSIIIPKKEFNLVILQTYLALEQIYTKRLEAQI